MSYELSTPTSLLEVQAAIGVRVLANRKVAVIGDSITYNSVWPSATEGVHPNGQARYLGHGYMTWAAYLSRQRFIFERTENFGIAGNDTYDILGGGPSNVPGRLTGALAANDAATWVLAVGTNDVKADYPVATIIANIETIIARILEANRSVIFVPPLPRDAASSSLSAAQKLRLAEIRRYFMTRLRRPRLHFVDAWEYMADPASTTGATKAAYTYDGLHPAQTGAYYVGLALA